MSEEFKFNPDQVANLNAYQVAGRFHPFTCPNRNLKTHRIFNGDLGALVATVRGWICPWCDYTQEWAHDFMCEPLPPDYVGEMLADHRDTTAIKQEREECAKVADLIAKAEMDYANKYSDMDGDRAEAASRTASQVAAAIRRRGE